MTVLAIGEHRRGELRDVSYELITAGRDLVEDTGGELHVGVISGPVEEYAESLSRESVDVVHTVDHGEEFNHDVYVQSVAQLTEAVDPTVLLMPHTANGLDYAPAVASRLERPLLTDAVGLSWDGILSVDRELYGGKTEATVQIKSDRAAATLRPTEWPPAEFPGEAEIRPFDVDIDESQVRSTVAGFEEVAGGDVDITEADVLVSVGRGIEEEENLDMIFELADAMGATVSASRPLIDNGWLEPERQVGQSGQVVTPDVYLAIGISGAVQHVAGMKGSDTIIAINKDPSAPIFDIADYGIVDDLFEVVPRLIEQFE